MKPSELPIPDEIDVACEQIYDRIVERGEGANPPSVNSISGVAQIATGQKPLDRLKIYKNEVMAFVYDFTVPFDNNLAERDIRMVKVQQKVSGGFRGGDGANVFCPARSYISTAGKNGQSILNVLLQTLNGTPHWPVFISTWTTE